MIEIFTRLLYYRRHITKGAYMKLNDFLLNSFSLIGEKLTTNEMARRLDIHPNSLWMLKKEKRIPGQALANAIESLTEGHVTAQELRADVQECFFCPSCGKKVKSKKDRNVLEESQEKITLANVT